MTIDLRSERLNRGLSLDALSNEVGVPKSTLARIEQGVTPRPLVQFKVASYYGYRVTDVWPVDEGAAA